jgi:hypothetical protein
MHTDPDEPDFGTDEQLDHDFEQWAANYDHAYVMTYEDPQYF